MNKTEQVLVGPVVTKIREPKQLAGAKVCLLLHGWTGDESSMWVFGNKLAEDWLLIAPRAPFRSVDADLGGYSWVDQTIRQWPTYPAFFSSVNYLDTLLSDAAARYPQANFSKISLMGFSQGSAMAFVYAGVNFALVRKLALLSGFLPEGFEGYVNADQFRNLEVFIGHGNADETVSINRAIEARSLFDGSCRSLVYCVSDVGHRLGSECFNALQRFMNE